MRESSDRVYSPGSKIGGVCFTSTTYLCISTLTLHVLMYVHFQYLLLFSIFVREHRPQAFVVGAGQRPLSTSQFGAGLSAELTAALRLRTLTATRVSTAYNCRVMCLINGHFVPTHESLFSIISQLPYKHNATRHSLLLRFLSQSGRVSSD